MALLLSKIPPLKNGTQHKWHLTTTLLAFWSTTNTQPIEPTPTVWHRRVIGISLWSLKKSTLKSHGRESESYKKLKNFLIKFTQLSPWHFLAFLRKVCHFLRYHFLRVSYLSISGGVFVMCLFCKAPLFSNDIIGCQFCWVCLMVVKL